MKLKRLISLIDFFRNRYRIKSMHTSVHCLLPEAQLSRCFNLKNFMPVYFSLWARLKIEYKWICAHPLSSSTPIIDPSSMKSRPTITLTECTFRLINFRQAINAFLFCSWDSEKTKKKQIYLQIELNWIAFRPLNNFSNYLTRQENSYFAWFHSHNRLIIMFHLVIYRLFLLLI